MLVCRQVLIANLQFYRQKKNPAFLCAGPAEAGSRYNIYDYQIAFEKAYKDIVSRGLVPILCGGSGLYIEAATCGYTLPQIPPDPDLRKSLEEA